MDSGLAAEPVIGPRFARTRWRRPGMTTIALVDAQASYRFVAYTSARFLC
jgi:hypothetical protein